MHYLTQTISALTGWYRYVYTDPSACQKLMANDKA